MVSKLTELEPHTTSVLIVDDSTQYAAVLTRLLSGVFGFKDITTVDNTKQAYDLVQANPERFRLMFVDYNFPDGHTGGELLARLNQSKLMQERVAFLITSEPTPENLKQATSAGALGVVAKPFDRAELKNQIDKARQRIQTDNAESF